MRKIDSDSLIEAEKIGIFLSEKVISQIEKYIELLDKWGSAINVTSIKNPIEIFRYHFLESFYCSFFIANKGTLADIGSGAGFPGLAIKLLKPALKIWLIEPREKKAFFLKEVMRSLHLKKVEVVQKRIEDLAPDDISEVNYITSRGMGKLESIAQWARKAMSSEGKILLLTGKKNIENIVKAGLVLKETYRLPTRREGFIALCQPTRNVSRETFSL